MTDKEPRAIHSFFAHEDGVTSASFCPNGKTLATGGYDCAIRLWEAGTGSAIQALSGHRRGHVAFSPDGKTLVSGGLHKNATVYDTATWLPKRQLYDTSSVWDLAFSANGSQIVIIQPSDFSDNPERPIAIRNTVSWRVKKMVDVYATTIYAVAFSPEGKRAAVATPGGVVSIWNSAFTSKLTEFTAHEQATWGLAFSHDGATLATGGADNIARLWETATWSAKYELQHDPITTGKDYGNAVLCVTFSPDGAMLVTGGLDGKITVWQL